MSDFIRFKHTVNHGEYWGRRDGLLSTEPETRTGWERNGILEHRTAVFEVRNGRNGPYPAHAVWIRSEWLEEIVDPPETTAAEGFLDAVTEGLAAQVEEQIRQATHWYGDGHDHGVEEGIDLEERPTEHLIAHEVGAGEPEQVINPQPLTSLHPWLRRGSYGYSRAMEYLGQGLSGELEPTVALTAARAMIEDELQRLAGA